MKIYTKTGDKGETSLYSGERVPKDSPRVEAYGIIDELDSALGLARALCVNQEVRAAVHDLQKLLWTVMAEVATIGGEPRVTAAEVAAVENLIDKFDAALPPLTAFIIPGDTPGGAALDLARTVARRAERQLWRVARGEQLGEHILVLVNRLSDLCFTLARAEMENKR
ncbi:cob(I)yrinic acid a,c-diamide adenosyltransferase [Anaeroselena agilis]|uniref:Corrinoid adenosyltransferase n=1 Tax=Anaeroselena agilis TaxID=3063788 RepID=A0ABU3NZD5_9FIRM|nr:cob(I)yrinic acid a,c-diamide adenosyltransferase [Selenomonadales bacterium 4137-cl]